MLHTAAERKTAFQFSEMLTNLKVDVIFTLHLMFYTQQVKAAHFGKPLPLSMYRIRQNQHATTHQLRNQNATIQCYLTHLTIMCHKESSRSSLKEQNALQRYHLH